MTNSLFIQYFNVFAEEDSKYHLSIEELYLYGLLSVLKNKEQLTITNVDILHQYSPISFFSREIESKQKIRNNLLSMRKREIINFGNDEIKNNTLLIISFVSKLRDDSIGKGVNGFEKVEFEKFNSFKNMIDNYIYFTVKRFDNLGGFRCDYSRWSYILNVAEKTAKIKVKESIENGIIYKNLGDYKEEFVNNRKQKKQEINTYKSIPFIEEEKTVQTKKVEVKELQQELIENEVSGAPANDDTETREHSWNVRNSELTVNDFYIYLTTNDDKLKKNAKGRINAICKSSKGDYFVNKRMEEAQDMIREVERKREQEILRAATNAIRLKTGEIVPVDASNIDNFKIEDIESLYYASISLWDGEEVIGELTSAFNITSFQPIRQDTHPNVLEYIDRPDMVALGFNKYKNIVKQGITFTFDMGNNIRNEVSSESGLVDEFESKRVVTITSGDQVKEKSEKRKLEEYDMSTIGTDLDIDLMNELMESNYKTEKEIDSNPALKLINQQFKKKEDKEKWGLDNPFEDVSPSNISHVEDDEDDLSNLQDIF